MKRFNKFHYKLMEAQGMRRYMPMEDPSIPYWHTYEMLVMWGYINQDRQEHNKPRIPFGDVKRVEQQASGHFDYTKKFALYCMELADA